MWSPEAGKKSYKKFKKNKKITAFDLHISLLCWIGPMGPIFTIFGVWGHIAVIITHVKY